MTIHPQKMPPDELREIGQSLFGPKWQKPLAAAIRVSVRSIYHWLGGTRRITPQVAAHIRSLS